MDCAPRPRAALGRGAVAAGLIEDAVGQSAHELGEVRNMLTRAFLRSRCVVCP